jgi:hypothetical protein
VAASTLVTAIGIAAIGLAAVAAVSLVFFLVGRSEDRERERAAADRPPATARRRLGHRLARRRGARD